jgi:hypothetical protein
VGPIERFRRRRHFAAERVESCQELDTRHSENGLVRAYGLIGVTVLVAVVLVPLRRRSLEMVETGR